MRDRSKGAIGFADIRHDPQAGANPADNMSAAIAVEQECGVNSRGLWLDR
jgi:hypothetical protein